MHAETGDVVEAGSLLVEIDKRTPRNSLSQTEAALTAAQARRKIAQTQMERAASLFKSQTLTQADYEQTQLEFANAESQVVSTKVAVENARITLEDTDVRAPITGTIIEKTVEPGTVIASTTQNVSGGTTLMKMADLTTVQVRTRVDETDIGKIQPGMRTRVTVAAYPNQPFDGEVLEDRAAGARRAERHAVFRAHQDRESRRVAEARHERRGRDPDRKSRRRCGRADGGAARRHRRDADGGDARARRGRRCARRFGPRAAPAGAQAKNVVSIGGREIELPAGVDAAKVTALMQKRQSGQELTAEERTLMRTVFQQAGGNFGGGGGGGGFGGSAADRRAAFAGRRRFLRGRRPTGRRAAPAARATDYLFGGEYWVVALRGDQTVPVAVKTGLTDLEYSEIVSGLEPGDSVLLLPSASLYEQQERLQEFINQRFGSTHAVPAAAAAAKLPALLPLRRRARRASVSLPGLTLAAEVWGAPGERPVLASHGWLDNAGSFELLAPLLPGCEIVALDLAGHGLSDSRSPDSSYNIWQDVGDLARRGRRARLAALHAARPLARRRHLDAVRGDVSRARRQADPARGRLAADGRGRRGARRPGGGAARDAGAARQGGPRVRAACDGDRRARGRLLEGHAGSGRGARAPLAARGAGRLPVARRPAPQGAVGAQADAGPRARVRAQSHGAGVAAVRVREPVRRSAAVPRAAQPLRRTSRSSACRGASLPSRGREGAIAERIRRFLAR